MAWTTVASLGTLALAVASWGHCFVCDHVCAGGVMKSGAVLGGCFGLRLHLRKTVSEQHWGRVFTRHWATLEMADLRLDDPRIKKDVVRVIAQYLEDEGYVCWSFQLDATCLCLCSIVWS